MAQILNCSRLATRDGFDAYVTLLFNQTDDKLTLLQQCKPEVCTALWGQGQGNNDISGIGVSEPLRATTKAQG